MRAALQQPEATDHDPAVTVLTAHAKDDGHLVGTIRMQHNTAGPLTIEASMDLPPALRARHLVEAARLCIEQGAPPVVRLALFKALFLHCKHHEVDAIVVVARRPLNRIYEQLGFRNALGPGIEVPMKHIGNLPHQLMVLHTTALLEEFVAAGHPMFDFVLRTQHPDILVPGTRRLIDPLGHRAQAA